MKVLTDYASFPKAAGDLKLRSYWFEGFSKPLVQS
jgi:hypothetical protein